MRQLKIGVQITNRQSQSLEKYFQEIGKIDMISGDEEVDLAKRIRQGDKMALQKLARANLRFVVSVAKQYHRGDEMTLGDLINEGNIGLMKAASRFDETRGFKFISYAVWWIRQAIMEAISQNSRMVRLPVNRVNVLNRTKRVFSNLEQKFEREPTDEELANALDISPQDVYNNRAISGRHRSLDAPLDSEEQYNLHDVMESEELPSPDSFLIEESLSKDVIQILDRLNQRESEVLCLFFGLNGKLPLSIYDIGEKLNLSGERIRQIKEIAIRKLQRDSRNRDLLKAHMG